MLLLRIHWTRIRLPRQFAGDEGPHPAAASSRHCGRNSPDPSIWTTWTLSSGMAASRQSPPDGKSHPACATRPPTPVRVHPRDGAGRADRAVDLIGPAKRRLEDLAVRRKHAGLGDRPHLALESLQFRGRSVWSGSVSLSCHLARPPSARMAFTAWNSFEATTARKLPSPTTETTPAAPRRRSHPLRKSGSGARGRTTRACSMPSRRRS